MTDTQLAAWEATRDLDAELLESVRQFKRGEGTVVYSPVVTSPKGPGTPKPDSSGNGNRGPRP